MMGQQSQSPCHQPAGPREPLRDRELPFPLGKRVAAGPCKKSDEIGLAPHFARRRGRIPGRFLLSNLTPKAP